MIRRDYLLRMIEELRRVLAAIIESKTAGRWQEASGSITGQMHRLVGVDPDAAARLTETELRARLVGGESTQIVPEKTQILAALFKEAGDIAEIENQPAEARRYRIKALELLLSTPASNDPEEIPDFIPRVESLATLLSEMPLAPGMQAGLMYHFERMGNFAKAEDSLHALWDADPQNEGILDFGIAFYERMLRLSDVTLLGGNLPRQEVESELGQWRQRSTMEPVA